MGQPQQQNECPICGKPPDSFRSTVDCETSRIVCARCGNIAISQDLIETLEALDETHRQLLPYLSAYTRQTSSRAGVVELDRGNWLEFAKSRANTPVQAKNSKLLDLVAGRSRYPGQLVEIDIYRDYPLVDASTPEELEFFLGHLMERNLVAKRTAGYWLTVDGWQLVDSKAGSRGQPGRAFVAMAFDRTLDEAFELGIRAALESDCGCQAIRLDKVEHNEKICDRIVAELRRASFVVADFTLNSEGVYFEAGFAMALGIPVVFSCRSDQIEGTHFDTRQYNHIAWDDPADLRRRLSERIRATIMTGVQS